MPLLDHIREFRNRLVRASLSVVIGSIVGWALYQPIIRLLTLPFCDLGSATTPNTAQCGDLYVNGILGPFNLRVKLLSFPESFWLHRFGFINSGLLLLLHYTKRNVE